MDMAMLRQKILYVALEPSIAELATHALCRFSGLTAERIRTCHLEPEHTTENEQSRLDEAIAKFEATELFLRLHGEGQGRSIEQVLGSCCRVRFDTIFVDHVGMIGRDEGRELDNLSHAIDRLRALSRGNIIPDYYPMVCLTSPLNRQGEQEGEETRSPKLSDFRGSSRIEYDADTAMILQKRKRDGTNEWEPEKVDAFILKNRFGPCPVVICFDAQGAISLVTEHRPEVRKAEQVELEMSED
jgi:replicative DNA helicase